jgi:hypothetical protein
MCRMKLIVNGVVFENPDRIDVRIEVDPAGEEVGPVEVVVAGGRTALSSPSHPGPTRRPGCPRSRRGSTN